MGFIDVKNLSHYFLDRDDDGNVIGEKIAIDDISLEVSLGDFICVLGHNGSGKSTFAKHLNAILLPTGGKIYVDGIDTEDKEKMWDIRQNTGMVFQNPDNQIISTVVEEDVAFGPENLGVETKEIWTRVEKALNSVNMIEYRKHSPNRLSGGQKQRVAIAGILAMHPKCIVLDEPTAMLDPNGRKEVMDTILELNKKEKVTIILVTHFMEEVVHADKVFVMDDGKIAMAGTPREVFKDVLSLKSLGLDVPDVTKLAHMLNEAGLEVGEGVIDIDELCDNIVSNNGKIVSDDGKIVSNDGINEAIFDNNIDNDSDIDIDNDVDNNINNNIENNMENDAENILLEVKNLSYTYSKGTSYERKAIDNVSFNVKKGEIVGIIGHTGSGKSTLIQHLNGLIKPENGEVLYKGTNIHQKGVKISDIRRKIGLVFQYPEYQLFESSVLEDVTYGPKNMGISQEESVKKAMKALKLVGFDEGIYNRSPFELSGGEKRRVAIAGILAMEPEILVLDEPTAGLDPKRKKEILSLLRDMRKDKNITIIIISHSMEDMAAFADRLLVMHKGKLIYDDMPANVFTHYKELENIGLAAPQILYIINKLRQKGLNIDGNPLTVEEAYEMILASIKKGKVC